MKQLQSSPLSNAVRRTCNILKQGATIQVLDYEQRFSSLKTLHQSLLTNLIKTEFPTKEAYETAKEFFGTTTVRFAGIDGTMYSRPLFDLVVFFGGAYASTGTITFHEDKLPTVKYDERTAKHGAGISSVVPIYVNEIPDVDQTFFEASQPDEVNLAKPLTEESIINNATVANWIMTFAEYYLAYKLVTDNEQKVRIILMDRSLSIERASLLYDTSKRALWEAKSNILGYKIDGEPIDTNELTIARHLVCNTHLGLPPPRADYIRYAIIDLLKRKGALSKKQILAEFGIKDEKRAKRVERNLKNLTKRGFLNEKNEIYTLNSKYAQTWERIKNLVKNIGDRFFFTENPETANLMKIVKDGKEHWLTTLDIAFLTLFTLHMLMEECWNRHILLIGVTKDTAARDFKRQLIPIMGNNDLLNANITSEELEKLPNTDRMILQSTSILNAEKITPPWSLIEYDSAFRTMIPDKQKRKGYVSGAIKNKIGLEKVFLKTYVQLSQAKTDPMLRSNVLLVDRLAYPEYDYKPENIVEFWNELSDGTKEPVEVILYIDKNVPNKLQNLTMNALVAMAPSNIPEAFGHNTPLFIADKIAKWNYSQFKRIVDTTAEWILNNHKLRRFIFYMSTFRERRTAIEAARREQI
ncbi:MAG: DNA double-strand break repair nuclease NurA [Candidatus Bathyarchaeia archaeon]